MIGGAGLLTLLLLVKILANPPLQFI